MARFSAHCYSSSCWRLSREFREGLPMELLYADDLVLIAEACRGIATGKVKEMGKGMGVKGLKNADKKKVMWCQVNKGQIEDSLCLQGKSWFGKQPSNLCLHAQMPDI